MEKTNRLDISSNCSCADGFYDDGNLKCKKCPLQCEKCSFDNTKKISCLSCSAFRINSPSCDCPDGYYDDGINQECQQCPNKCKTCQLKNQNIECTSCLDSESYFDGNQKECLPCDPKCKSCQQDANNCTSCHQSQGRILNGNNCECSSEYIEQNPPQLNCVSVQSCDSSCKQCTEFQNKDKCTECDDLRTLVVLGDKSECQCKQSFYEDKQRTCSSCDLTCQTCFGGSKDNCLSCNESEQFSVLDQSTNTCNCKKGYYLSNDSCSECSITCQSCSGSSDSCQSCFAEQNRYLKDNACICLEKYVQIRGDPICQKCGAYCQTCDSKNQQKCLSCNSLSNRNLNLQTGKCQCQIGYYSLNEDEVCTKCHDQCRSCEIHSTNCTSCSSPLRVVSKSNGCICKDTYYENPQTKQCLNCPQGCKKCQNSEKCIECLDNYDFSSKDVCVKIFPSNTTKEQIKTVMSSTESTVYATSGSTLAGSVILSSIQPNGSIASYFVLLQKLNFMLLINIAYPQLLYGFFKTFGGQSPIDSLKKTNILNDFIINDTQGILLPHKFETEKIGNSIFYNFGGGIVIVTAFWVICLPIIVMYKRNDSIRDGVEITKYSTKLIQFFCEKVYPMIIVLMHQILSMFLSFSIGIQLSAIQLNNVQSEINFKYRMIITIILIFYLLYITIKTYKIINQQNNYQQDKNLHYKERIEQYIYQHINLQNKTNNYLTRNYKFIFILIENILFPFCIIFFDFDFKIQLGLCLGIQVILCTLTVTLLPMKEKIDNFFLILDQVCWVTILTCIYVSGIKISSIKNTDYISNYDLNILSILSWIVIGSCILILLSNPLYLIALLLVNIKHVIQSIKQILEKIRNLFTKKDEKQENKVTSLSLYDFNIKNTSMIWDKSIINQRSLLSQYTTSRQTPALTSASILQMTTPQNNNLKVRLKKSIVTRKISDNIPILEKNSFPSPQFTAVQHPSQQKK